MSNTLQTRTPTLAADTLLSVRNLQTHFFSREGAVKAVDGVSFDIKPGEILGIAGESGCGKSVTSQSIMRILPKNGKIVGGEILFNHANQTIDLATTEPEGRLMRAIRGKEIAMIFQEPMTAFSPVHTIGNQIIETIRIHQPMSQAEAREQAIEMLHRVGMPNPGRNIDQYTFNLSGGMRQRAMVALALSCRPKLLIADEPTTAVDVTIQAQILKLLREIQADLGMAIIMITHDLGVIAELTERVMIMYLGKEVEYTAPNTRIHAACWPRFPRWSRAASPSTRLKGRCPAPMPCPPVANSIPVVPTSSPASVSAMTRHSPRLPLATR